MHSKVHRAVAKDRGDTYVERKNKRTKRREKGKKAKGLNFVGDGCAYVIFGSGSWLRHESSLIIYELII